MKQDLFFTFGSSLAIHNIFFIEFLQPGRGNNLLINHSRCNAAGVSDRSLAEQ